MVVIIFVIAFIIFVVYNLIQRHFGEGHKERNVKEYDVETPCEVEVTGFKGIKLPSIPTIVPCVRKHPSAW